jgi:hypothetical protein
MISITYDVRRVDSGFGELVASGSLFAGQSNAVKWATRKSDNVKLRCVWSKLDIRPLLIMGVL